jgi:hypothetical protein
MSKITMDELSASTKEALKTDLSPINDDIQELLDVVKSIEEKIDAENNLKRQLVDALVNLGFDVSMNNTLSELLIILESIKLGQGDALPGDVLAGKTFTNNTGELLTGEIITRSENEINTKLNGVVLEPGYYAGDIKIPAAQGSAVVSDVLSGKTFTNNTATTLNGNMTNHGNKSVTPSSSNQTLSAGYYSGISVKGDNNLVASNIKSGVDIFGTIGTCTGTTTDGGRIVVTNLRSLEGGEYGISGSDYDDVTTETITHGFGFKPARILFVIPYQYLMKQGNAGDFADDTDSFYATTAMVAYSGTSSSSKYFGCPNDPEDAYGLEVYVKNITSTTFQMEAIYDDYWNQAWLRDAFIFAFEK